MVTFADRECLVVSTTDPHGRILGFLDQNGVSLLGTKQPGREPHHSIYINILLRSRIHLALPTYPLYATLQRLGTGSPLSPVSIQM
jgi:hypothetical protein